MKVKQMIHPHFTHIVCSIRLNGVQFRATNFIILCDAVTDPLLVYRRCGFATNEFPIMCLSPVGMGQSEIEAKYFITFTHYIHEENARLSPFDTYLHWYALQMRKQTSNKYACIAIDNKIFTLKMARELNAFTFLNVHRGDPKPSC